MYFQIDLTNASANYPINFIGRCKVRLLNVLYNDTNGVIKYIKLVSSKLKTSYGNVNDGFMFVTNSQQSSVAGTGTTTNICYSWPIEFEFDSVGFINISIIDVLTNIAPNTWTSCLLTFDLEKIDMLK